MPKRSVGAPKLKYNPLTNVTTLDGIPLVDAVEDLEVDLRNVKAKGAEPGNARKCMFSIKAKKALKVTDVITGRSCTYIGRGNYYVRYMTPPALRVQEAVFDQKGNFFDAVYVLKAPRGFQALGHARERIKKCRANKKAEKRDISDLSWHIHKNSPHLRPRI